MIISVALLDHEMVARQPERGGVIEFQIWLQRRQPFPCNRPPANDERQIAELERSVELTLQPRILGSEIGLLTDSTAVWLSASFRVHGLGRFAFHR